MLYGFGVGASTFAPSPHAYGHHSPWVLDVWMGPAMTWICSPGFVLHVNQSSIDFSRAPPFATVGSESDFIAQVPAVDGKVPVCRILSQGFSSQDLS